MVGNSFKNKGETKMNNIQQQIDIINAMSDSEVLVATALANAKIYGQIPEHWEMVAILYDSKTISEYKADLMIEERLGDEYCLDPEICREWLITEAQYRTFEQI
jgi:hypothetical protein